LKCRPAEIIAAMINHASAARAAGFAGLIRVAIRVARDALPGRKAHQVNRLETAPPGGAADLIRVARDALPGRKAHQVKRLETAPPDGAADLIRAARDALSDRKAQRADPPETVPPDGAADLIHAARDALSDRKAQRADPPETAPPDGVAREAAADRMAVSGAMINRARVTGGMGYPENPKAAAPLQGTPEKRAKPPNLKKIPLLLMRRRVRVLL